jgi:hypothetical protein
MPQPASFDALSTEYVWVPVIAPVNTTADPVSIAFKTSGKPSSGDWHTAAWDDKAARILVGPGNGGVVLTAGTYSVWVKVTDDPAVPVINAGQLVIT